MKDTFRLRPCVIVVYAQLMMSLAFFYSTQLSVFLILGVEISKKIGINGKFPICVPPFIKQSVIKRYSIDNYKLHLGLL